MSAAVKHSPQRRWPVRPQLELEKGLKRVFRAAQWYVDANSPADLNNSPLEVVASVEDYRAKWALDSGTFVSRP